MWKREGKDSKRTKMFQGVSRILTSLDFRRLKNSERIFEMERGVISILCLCHYILTDVAMMLHQNFSLIQKTVSLPLFLIFLICGTLFVRQALCLFGIQA